MDNPSNEVVFYIARTNQQDWGRGETIREALQNAYAIGKSGKLRKYWLDGRGKRHPFKVVLDKCIQTDADLLTQEHLDYYARTGVRLEGFEVGDRLPPFVGCYGQICGHATKWENGIEVPSDLR